ncbi:MAG: TolC family outer membrane protein [Burkholderiales bacterium]
MRVTRSFLPSIVAVCLSAVCTARAEDLLDVYRLALENDPAIKAAAAANAAAQEARPKSLSLLLPQVSASADAGRAHEEITNATGLLTNTNQRFDERGVGLNLVQSIYNHANYAQLRQADNRLVQASAEYGTAQQDLILRTVRGYLDVLAAEEHLTFARAEKKSLAERLEQARRRHQAGAATLTLVLEVQARYELSVAQEITALNALDSAREALQAIIGTAPGKLNMLVEKLPLTMPDPEDMTAWVNLALKQNLSLLAAQAAEQVAREEVTRQRAGHLPTVDLVAGLRYDTLGGGSFGARDQTVNRIGVRLNVPILNGGLVSALTREAEQRHIQANESRTQTQRTVERAARDAYRGVTAGIASVQAFKQAVTFSDAALKSVEISYEAGKRTIQDVFAAESSFYRALRDYADARYNYLLNIVRLKFVVGSLGVSDLEQMNTYLTAAARQPRQ